MILYKFMSLEPFEHVADALLARRLYCPRPSELNDPLEGSLGVTALTDPAEGSESQFEKSVRFWEGFDMALNRFRVCCFSAVVDSPLLWAHYGRGHAGICLELDVSAYASQLVQVQYANDLTAHATMDVRVLLGRKSHHWAYEHEFRIVSPAGHDSTTWIEVDIRSVLIGAAMRPEHMRPLFEMLRLTRTSAELASFGTSGDFIRLPIRNDIFAARSPG